MATTWIMALSLLQESPSLTAGSAARRKRARLQRGCRSLRRPLRLAAAMPEALQWRRAAAIPGKPGSRQAAPVQSRRRRKMRYTFALSSAALLALTWLPAAGQDYPSKPIRVVVPVAAGGSPDVLARLIGERIRPRLGQPFVVDNRAGAGQMIGSDLVAKAAPDGYTIMLPTATYTGSAAIQPKLPFDPVNDLTGVAMVGVGPFLVIVHPSVPVKNIKELIAL